MNPIDIPKDFCEPEALEVRERVKAGLSPGYILIGVEVLGGACMFAGVKDFAEMQRCAADVDRITRKIIKTGDRHQQAMSWVLEQLKSGKHVKSGMDGELDGARTESGQLIIDTITWLIVTHPQLSKLIELGVSNFDELRFIVTHMVGDPIESDSPNNWRLVVMGGGRPA